MTRGENNLSGLLREQDPQRKARLREFREFHRKYRELGMKGIVLMSHLEFCRTLRAEVGIEGRNVKT